MAKPSQARTDADFDAEMAEIEAGAEKANEIDRKLDHARRMAEGEIMTCLGPADRHALRMLISELDNYDAAFDKLSDAYGIATGLLSECLYFGSMTASQMEDLTKRIEEVLDGK